MTLIVAPNSINALTLTTGSSGGILIGMEYYGSPVAAPDGSLAKSIAVTDWISHNSNYTQWTFNVKPGLKWSNGQNITSKDILTTFSPAFGFNATYDYLGMGPEVSNQFALNSSAAVYVLKAPDAHWSDKFNWDLYSPVYPASFIQQQGAGSSNFGTNVEAGPFYVSNYQSGQSQMVMLRNSYFTPQPKISQININFVDSLSLTAGYLLAGSTDLAPIEPSNAHTVTSNPNIHVLDEKGLYISDIQYNDSLYPYNMTNFRQALAYGINQTQFISQALNGYAIPAYSAEGIVSPTASQWYNPNIQKYAYNQTASLQLLKQIGITKGSDGILHYRNGTAVKLTLWTDTANVFDATGASAVQANLQSLGFKINVITASVSSIVGDYVSSLSGIRSAMILSTSNPPVWGNGYLDAQPAWNVYWLATTANHHWEYPPSADAQYQGNYTAFFATGDTASEQKYLNNIQAINAHYLPTLVLAYPDALWGYNTQYWTNWPTGYVEYGAQIMNNTAFANLQPVSSTTSSSSSAPTSTSTTGSASSVPTQTTTTSQASTNPAPGYDYTPIAGVAIALLVVVAAATYIVRRRKR
jgi:peptide/nickel transport system substrate-binding protein